MTSTGRGSLTVSDPWDLAAIVGCEPLAGIVERWTPNSATLRLDRPLTIDQAVIVRAEVSIRHVGREFAEQCTAIPANISFLTEDQAPAFAAIGSLSIS
jgi:hypothetical protein